MKLKLSIITSCIALALAGSANAAVFTSLPWTGDGDLSFITSTNVTHSGDFDSAASINGFTFEQISITQPDFGTLTVPYSGSNFTINASATPFTFTGGAGAVSGTASTPLSSGLMGDGVSPMVAEYNLTGLSINTNYEFYFFNPDWSDPTVRTGTLEGSVDPGNTFAISQTGGVGDSIIRYAYNTGASTSFTMTVTSNALHQYSFVNVTAIPEPSTWALLAFSLTAVTVLRRRGSSASQG